MQAIMKTKREVGFEIQEVPEPEIKAPYEVKIKVNAASICGTDVHMYEFDQWAQNRLKPPFIAGHEVGGTVIEIGSDVRNLEVGDRVSMECHLACGTCYQCRTDRMHICRYTKVFGVDMDGIFTNYAVIPELNAWKNDPDLDPRLASLQDPLGNAVQTVLPKDNIEDIAGKTVCVIGCGPIGLMSIAVAKALGAAQVFATAGGSNMLRLNLAKEMGADMVLNARKDGDKIPQIIRDATNGDGVDVALEMSGYPSGMQNAVDMLTMGGRISMLGFFSRPFEQNPQIMNQLVTKAVNVHGIAGRRMFQTWVQMRGLLKQKSFQERIAKVITHRITMEDFQKGMDELLAKNAIKVVMEPFKE
ncbi:MAG: L-threonine 3-dehydrogenase [Candidatus Odinarchaeota archaeon]